MLLALLAAAAVAAPSAQAEPAAPAVQPHTVATATVEAKAKAKAKVICVDERPTGSRRIQRVCYEKEARDQAREEWSNRHVSETPSLGGGIGSPR